MFRNMEISNELIANNMKLQLSLLPLLYSLYKRSLARHREQQGSGVSDYVVSHGGDCFETPG